MAELTPKVKKAILLQYLDTPEGRHKVYKSVLSPMKTRMAYCRLTGYEVIPEKDMWELMRQYAIDHGVGLWAAWEPLLEMPTDENHPFLRAIPVPDPEEFLSVEELFDAVEETSDPDAVIP